jgi:hypothetical protein
LETLPNVQTFIGEYKISQHKFLDFMLGKTAAKLRLEKISENFSAGG